MRRPRREEPRPARRGRRLPGRRPGIPRRTARTDRRRRPGRRRRARRGRSERAGAAADVQHVLPARDARRLRELRRQRAAVPAHERLVGVGVLEHWLSDPGELIGRVDIGQQRWVDLDHEPIEFGERPAEREASVRERRLQCGQRSPPVGTGEGAGLRNGDVGSGGGQVTSRRASRGACRPAAPRTFVRGSAQAGDDPGDRRADVASVVEQREGSSSPSAAFPTAIRSSQKASVSQAISASVAAVDAGERLRRAEPRARPADEQDAGQPCDPPRLGVDVRPPPRTKPQSVRPRSAASSTARLDGAPTRP